MKNWYKFFYSLILIFSFAVVVSAATPVHSATISFEDNVIYIQGDILEGTAEAFQKTLELHPEATVVSITSVGGVVSEGMIISTEVFNRGMTTYIPKNGVCDSLCPIIFLSGKEKVLHIDQFLGFHPPYIEKDGQRVIHTKTVADISWWLGHVGIPLEIVWAMMESPPENVFTLSGIDLLSVGVNVVIMN
jgi:hypothetical protein